MEQRDFIFWLQGFAELNKQAPTQEQWDSICEHLQLCFNKVTKEVEELPYKLIPVDYPNPYTPPEPPMVPIC